MELQRRQQQKTMTTSRTKLHPYIYAGLPGTKRAEYGGEVVDYLESVLKAVCLVFDIEMSDLKSQSRRREFAMPRQCAMYVLKKTTNLTYSAIGRFLGRDHATVIYGVRQCANLRRQIYEFDQQVRSVIALI